MRLFTILLVGILLLPGVGQAQTATQMRAWTYHREVDPLTDKGRETVVAADSELTAILGWQCYDGTLRVVLSTTDYLGSSDRRAVAYRFDHDSIVYTMWLPGTDGKMAGPPEEQIGRLTEQAKKARRLVIRISDFERVRHTYIFSLMGFTKQFQRLTCR